VPKSLSISQSITGVSNPSNFPPLNFPLILAAAHTGLAATCITNYDCRFQPPNFPTHKFPFALMTAEKNVGLAATCIVQYKLQRGFPILTPKFFHLYTSIYT